MAHKPPRYLSWLFKKWFLLRHTSFVKHARFEPLIKQKFQVELPFESRSISYFNSNLVRRARQGQKIVIFDNTSANHR